MKILAIITGVLTAILGFMAFGMPLRTFLGLGWLLGALLLINGVELVIGAFLKKKDIWQCILGIITAIGGGIILFNGVQRIITDVILAYLAGFVIIFYGISMIHAGAKGMKLSKTAGILSIVFGVLAVIVGGASIMHPFVTMISIGYLIAASVAIQGINIVVMALTFDKLNKSEG